MGGQACTGRKGAWFKIRRSDGAIEIYSLGCPTAASGVQVDERTEEGGYATHELWGRTYDRRYNQYSAYTLLNRSTVNLPGSYWVETQPGTPAWNRFNWRQSNGTNTVVGSWFRSDGVGFDQRRVGGVWWSKNILSIYNNAGSSKTWENAQIIAQVCSCPWDMCQVNATGLDDQGRELFCCYSCGTLSAAFRNLMIKAQSIRG